METNGQGQGLCRLLLALLWLGADEVLIFVVPCAADLSLILGLALSNWLRQLSWMSLLL